jgi:DNA modification methylase
VTSWTSDCGRATLYLGDCREVMAELPEASVDAVITDPPYGLLLMGKDWDRGVPGEGFWRDALRVAKPGAHLAAFGGTRTHHRLMCAIEDAGWEIRDCLMWLHGQGMPKSHNVSKAIDKHLGVERPVIGTATSWNRPDSEAGHAARMNTSPGEYALTAPATDAAQQWEGWGTALKPAWEIIILARKPLEGTVAANVMRHGTGGINVDACRVGNEMRFSPPAIPGKDTFMASEGSGITYLGSYVTGRWPANLLLSDIDLGGKERYFYCPKVSRKERSGNTHPTVKPVDLMAWLCRLITPPGGTVLDPFMGSGSTGVAAIREGARFIGAEINPEYFEIAKGRIAAEIESAERKAPTLFDETEENRREK